MKKNILVTGGAGYVGSHACRALSESGFTPVVFDNLGRGYRDFVKWGPLIEGDILDKSALGLALEEVKPLAVMHFAAYSHVGESMTSPEMYYHNNVLGTLSLLESMAAAKLGNIVFSSSCAVYGGEHHAPLDESTVCIPDSTYGFSKLACEHLLRDFVRARSFSAVALRYFNAAGADPDGLVGEAHVPEPHLIPNVLAVAAQVDARNELRINGRDYPTPDGTCVRDFIHVADLATAHVKAVERILKSPERRFEAFNLGVGRGYSIEEVIAAAKRVTGREIASKYVERRPGDSPFLIGNAQKANRELDWTPKYQSIEPMLEHAWKWMLAQKGNDRAHHHAH